jgi:hypothetical protein
MLRAYSTMYKKARMARSGVSYVGIPALLRMVKAPSMLFPPIQQANTGYWRPFIVSARVWATLSGSVSAWGARITQTPSVSFPSKQTSRVCRKRSGEASPRMSMGLLRLQNGGRKASSFRRVSGSRGAGSRPLRARVSVAITPGPPALVTMASRGPRGRGCLAISSAQSNRS